MEQEHRPSNERVAKLRKWALHMIGPLAPADIVWAADEIERLTAEWTKLEAQYSDLWRGHCDQRDDYDRLRAALEHIAREPYGMAGCTAREALAGAPDETACKHNFIAGNGVVLARCLYCNAVNGEGSR